MPKKSMRRRDMGERGLCYTWGPLYSGASMGTLLSPCFINEVSLPFKAYSIVVLGDRPGGAGRNKRGGALLGG